ncbi:WD40 repeat domain-containing protein [Actinomadura sp. WAC 06369]|uniref:WD40 repeat domain-containing protein n=1 Tax=Actinomadura sp. WAC 06369 TaxID=2203193 RepID=UPI000F7AC5F9|nr:WD40 repeat domain-containing protein [Actinomadura sp. WAC 06369]RSN68109.1 hypothetical protein DMH08_11905 [Actinomadura sp. WAC 06369]
MADDASDRRRPLYADPEWSEDPDSYEGPVDEPDERPDFSSGIVAVAASPDLERVAMTTASQGNTESGRFTLFETETGTRYWRDLEEERRFVGDGHEIAFSPDGSLVAVAASTDLKVVVWRTDGMTVAWSAGADPAWGDGTLFTGVRFSGDGRRVVAVSGRPWEPEPDEAVPARVVVAEAGTGAVVFAETVRVRGGADLDHRGERLAYLGADGRVVIRDVSSGEVVAEHRSGVPGARLLAFSDDGGAVAVGGDGAAEVIRTATGASRGIPITGTCLAVAWSARGLRVLAADDDRAAVVDAEGRVLWERYMDDAPLLLAAFTHDGRVMVTLDPDATEVVGWFFPNPDEMDESR